MSLADDNATTTVLATPTDALPAKPGPLLAHPAHVAAGTLLEQSFAAPASDILYCRRVWERVHALGPCIFLTLPTASHVVDDRDSALPYTISFSARDCTEAALEAQKALLVGIRAGTGPALVMLGAIALAHYDGGEAAARLAQVGLEIAAMEGGPHEDLARVLHATLLLPLLGKPDDAVRILVPLIRNSSAASLAALGLAGIGFASGMPLSTLSQHLDLAAPWCGAEAASGVSVGDLVTRATLLRRLRERKSAPTAHDAGGALAAGEEERFGEWLTRLQTAWYAGNQAIAYLAAMRAMGLLSPLIPLTERLIWHTFSALTLSRSHDASATDLMRFHAAALRRLSASLPAVVAMAELAEAARDRRRGDGCTALRGFEAVAACATGQARHWLAGLAWEEAAMHAAESCYPSAARHYQQQALESYRQWGALGRVDYLQCLWNAAAGSTSATPAEPDAATLPGATGELGLSIAHEVSQPLAAITLHAAAARRWLRRSQPDIDRALASLSLISAAGQQVGGIVRSVQRLATHQDIEMTGVVVDDAIAEALQLLQGRLKKHSVDMDMALSLGEQKIQANRIQLQQVVTNLVVNAIEALADIRRAPLRRRIRVESRASDQQIEIAVIDNGPGIKSADRDLMFGSLFSTKPANTGMGLSICLAIARAHGGHIAFEPCEPHGACFRFRLPAGGKNGITAPLA
jgi:signal transduction histidine kinase